MLTHHSVFVRIIDTITAAVQLLPSQFNHLSLAAALQLLRRDLLLGAVCVPIKMKSFMIPKPNSHDLRTIASNIGYHYLIL